MVNILGLSFHLYGLLIGLGVWLAFEMSLRVARRWKIKVKILDQALWWAVIPGVIGARIYHVIDLWDEYYRFDWVKSFCLWEGGLGIWGGVIGGVLGLAGFYLIRKKILKIKFLSLLDLGAIGLPLAQAIGRWGNFVNRELYGRPTSLPWGIQVPGSEVRVHPLFLYESLLDLMLFMGLVGVVYSSKEVKPGKVLGLYLIGYGIIRFVLEPWRVASNIWTWNGLIVAQIVSVVAILVGLVLLFREKILSQLKRF